MNGRGRQDASRSEVVGVDRFVTTNRRADWAMDLPLGALPPGAYLLTIDGSAGTEHVVRNVRFDVT